MFEVAFPVGTFGLRGREFWSKGAQPKRIKEDSGPYGIVLVVGIGVTGEAINFS
jgi:hypothetical protein